MEDHQEAGWQDNSLPSLGFSTTWGMRLQGVTEDMSRSHPSELPGIVILLRETPQTVGSE